MSVCCSSEYDKGSGMFRSFFVADFFATYTPGVAGLLLKHSVRLACLSSISRREDTDPRHKFSTAPALSCAVIMLPCYHDQRSFCTRHSTLHVMNGVASAYDNQEGARRAMHILSSHLVRTDWTYSLSSLLSLIIFLFACPSPRGDEKAWMACTFLWMKAWKHG